MKQVSKSIETNQEDPHARLEETVRKHMQHAFRRPIADHTKRAFAEVEQKIASRDRPLILDACCGTGDSSRKLAELHADHWVVGVDKSEHRLSRERVGKPLPNLILVRADLNDFYRLAATSGWKPAFHYILYPNPWPKAEHLGRRWHGAPVFPFIVKVGGQLEVRSNWKIYLQEFAAAIKIMGFVGKLEAYEPQSYLTLFEKKYHESRQDIWRFRVEL